MFLHEILDLVVPIKIELKKVESYTHLEESLKDMEESLITMLKSRNEALTKATSVSDISQDIDTLSDALAIMALVKTEGVSLFGSLYNATHPEKEASKEARRKSFGEFLRKDSGSKRHQEKRPLFKRKRRLGDSDRVL
tara:strand:+ start:461 stop:874 length:414 start_codon:yes stop_codon:yes gene_type:complete